MAPNPSESALPGSEAERALKRSEASFRMLIENLPDGVVVHRAEQIVYVNPSAVRLFGYASAEEMVGMPMLCLAHPDEHALIRERIAMTMSTGLPAPAREMRLVRKDGTTGLIEVTGLSAIFDGQPSFAALMHDVMDKRAMMSQLAQRDRLASMGLLAASVAHEVNNPITYVLLNLERLEKELPAVTGALSAVREELHATLGADEARAIFRRTGAARAEGAAASLAQRVELAIEGARQVSRISRDLRAFARVEEEGERVSVDINALLDKVIDLAANELRFRATVVRDYGELPGVVANEGRLSQVFLNLIINAAHAIEEGAPERNEVRVRTSWSGAEVRIVVADTGSGIPKEHLQRLFDPFFTTKGPGLGSGLGLSICRDIVSGHAGRIEVESAAGVGSRFTVHLPIGEGSDAAPAPPSSAAPGIPFPARRPRLLVVDDERVLRSTLEVLLEDHYEVVLAESGAAAFEVLSQDRRYDVILCDLMMPEISGMQVHAWVEQEAPELLPRMVFMTGGAFTRNASEFLEQVVNRHIEKPFDVQNLLSLLDKVARR